MTIGMMNGHDQIFSFEGVILHGHDLEVALGKPVKAWVLGVFSGCGFFRVSRVTPRENAILTRIELLCREARVIWIEKVYFLRWAYIAPLESIRSREAQSAGLVP